MLNIDDIDDMLSQSCMELKKAATLSDVSRIKGLTAQITRLDKLRSSTQDVITQFARIRDDWRIAMAPGLKRDGGGYFVVNVTRGMYKNDMLCVTQGVKAKYFEVGDEIRFRIEKDGECFTTEILNPGYRFRDRRNISIFYRQFSVQPGNTVGLTEDQDGIWTLLARPD